MEDAPVAVGRVVALLDALEPDPEGAWTESPSASVVRLESRGPALLEVGLLGGGWVRLPQGDAPAARTPLWTWLADAGVHPDS